MAVTVSASPVREPTMAHEAPMLCTITTKTLRDGHRALLYWVVAVAALIAMYVEIYPSVRGNAMFTDFLNQLPESYRALFTAGGGDFTSPSGYLNTELMSMMGPLVVLLFAVTGGAAAIAGEEDRRTLDLLLANPVRRSRVVLEKFAALCGGLVVVLVALWASLAVGTRLVGMDIELGRITAAVLSLGLLGMAFGACTLAIGCQTGRPGLSRSVAGLVAVVGYLLNGLAPMVGWLQPLRPLSPFHYYIGNDPLRSGLALDHVAVLLAVTVALVAWAVLAFQRRDIAT